MEEGRTRQDRLESRLERAIRKKRLDIAQELEAELRTPPFPLSLTSVWLAWSRMRRRVPPSEVGTPLSWQDIEAFSRLTGTHLSPRDVEMIEALDDQFLQSSRGAETAKPPEVTKANLLALGKKPRG